MRTSYESVVCVLLDDSSDAIKSIREQVENESKLLKRLTVSRLDYFIPSDQNANFIFIDQDAESIEIVSQNVDIERLVSICNT